MSTADGDAVTVLHRPVGEAELGLIEANGWRAFPPRLAHQPIFHPVLDEAYAARIARDWNTEDAASGYAGYVTRFAVRAEASRGISCRPSARACTRSCGSPPGSAR